MSDSFKPIPELLCPAGSPDALDAAIEGGADAVYLGGTAFNARIHAKNFGGDALRSAVLRAHAFGVKVYLTLNTLVTDRELDSYVQAAQEAAEAGVDALIVADVGGAAAIHRCMPALELHASTQMSGHNLLMANQLRTLGFSRMVVARETSAEDLHRLMQSTPIEIELFIHGALCVSHSGQCLFSSLVGGRSGNRGECAQPCRLPFSCKGCSSGGKEQYPLSLKDLSLAAHVPELIDLGISSLKIEGRMKSPEYVRDTTRIWRRLLDERRAATKEEMQELASIFSRGGFTDGYYQKKINRTMLGVRSEADKSDSRTLTPFQGLTRRIALSANATLRLGFPARFTLFDGIRTSCAEGDIPQKAQNAPLSQETVERNLSKFGGTPYLLQSLHVEMDDGIMLPISRLNDLRRRALQALEDAKAPPIAELVTPYAPQVPHGTRKHRKTARFYRAEQITDRAKAYFDRIYLPLDRYEPCANGVVLPPVIFDGDCDKIRVLLKNAARMGAKYALVGNIGHLPLVREAGLEVVGDFRLNACNTQSVAALERMGYTEVLLSPELTLPQIRDIKGDVETVVYGRLPLMTLEKCVIRDMADCRRCEQGTVTLRDRRGVEFPILREWEHRNLILNSLPTGMSDRADALFRAHVTAQHFLFYTESAEEIDRIIAAYTTQQALPFRVRRIAE